MSGWYLLIPVVLLAVVCILTDIWFPTFWDNMHSLRMKDAPATKRDLEVLEAEIAALRLMIKKD